jgi:ribosome modulation factor
MHSAQKLGGCRAACLEALETARDAGKVAAEVACGCELCIDRLTRAVSSGQGTGSIGRAANAVGYQDLRVLSVWGAYKYHAEVDQGLSGEKRTWTWC